MQTSPKPRWSLAKIAVVVAVVGALVFGLVLGLLEYQNDSFPATTKPFGDYAAVVASEFNGTEVYFQIEWTASGNYTPLYAQITSDTDIANSPVCLLGMNSISKGQTVDMPFAVAGTTSALADVNLAVAVRANSNMSEFTIQYQMGQVEAQPGNILPSTFACSAQNQNPAI
ncbi:MAG TPA: hypothetical protein VLY21_05550 [Nitrososphaerales archaeon]|nr:hypothetical protein [Nitrososphaerales archaeon]